ncbi:NAD(P)/FAD-dependent oxidoreductase [Variovorax sp. HJSM1_2]|uniref:NAD(P)/FAD-dependent oxidoreductase n=1 Tax=Variovorax sp. HJSM1_2 TaxID=3366263 RepID=UPI003BE9C878
MNRTYALSPTPRPAQAQPGARAVAAKSQHALPLRQVPPQGAAAHAVGLSGYLASLGQRAGWAGTGRGARVAVVGSGIAGLSAAWTLSQQAHVTLFEAGVYFGGHTHTVDVALEGQRCGVDTGFLVFNERTYPLLIQLFAQLGVETVASEMSFSVQLPSHGREGLEWSGSNLNSVFSQRSNLLRPGFWRMLRDLLRFNRITTALAEEGQEAALAQPIGEFLQAHGFSAEFRDWYLLPMVACIWSCPTEQMLQFPVQTLIRFCHNHGLLQVANRPQWFTVRGGARHYVDKLLRQITERRLNTPVLGVQRQPGGVVLRTAHGVEHFDAVVLASHSDQSLRLLSDASREEQQILGAVRYHQNRAVLHTDTTLLPRHRRSWAAWNYERGAGGQESQAVCLHYLLNRLQPLPWQQPTMVSLNPVREPAAPRVLGEYDYAHPVFDQAAIQAQQRLGDIQGNGKVWFCGAWTRYGFHEDGLLSGLRVAQKVAATLDLQSRAMS